MLIQAAGIYNSIDKIERKVVLTPDDVQTLADLKMQERKMRQVICKYAEQLMEQQHV